MEDGILIESITTTTTTITITITITIHSHQSIISSDYFISIALVVLLPATCFIAQSTPLFRALMLMLTVPMEEAGMPGDFPSVLVLGFWKRRA